MIFSFLKEIEKHGIDIDKNYHTLIVFYNRNYSVDYVVSLFNN